MYAHNNWEQHILFHTSAPTNSPSHAHFCTHIQVVIFVQQDFWIIFSQVTATNKDGDSDGIVYRILSGTDDWLGKFAIDSSGEITVSDTLDAEVTMMYTLFVEAQDTRTQIIRLVNWHT